MAFLKLILFVIACLLTVPATAYAAGRKGPTDDSVPSAADLCPMGKYVFETSPLYFLGADGYDLVLTDHRASTIGEKFDRMCFSTREYIPSQYVTAPDGTRTYVEAKLIWSESLVVMNNVLFHGAFAVSGKWYFTFTQLGEGYDFVIGFNPATRQFSKWPYVTNSYGIWDWANLPEGTSGKNEDR